MHPKHRLPRREGRHTSPALSEWSARATGVWSIIRRTVATFVFQTLAAFNLAFGRSGLPEPPRRAAAAAAQGAALVLLNERLQIYGSGLQLQQLPEAREALSTTSEELRPLLQNPKLLVMIRPYPWHPSPTCCRLKQAVVIQQYAVTEIGPCQWNTGAARG